MSEVKVTGLELMRKPFEPHQISKMCKSTKKDNQPGRCRDCGGYHKLPSVQLSYVGHAAITDRLLEADSQWSWEPLSFAADGTPFLDANGGMWIKLTVAGVTRLGYGDAQGKTGGDAMKERIGDALRNAAMRFGAALDLWHKGDLHGPEEEESEKFEKQADGSFAKVPEKTSALNNGQAVAQPSNPNPTSVSAQKPTAKVDKETVQKIKSRTSPKKSEPTDYLPWGGQAGAQMTDAQGPGIAVNNAITPENPITDADVQFPGDPEPPSTNPVPDAKKADTRLSTEAERKVFVERAKVLKAKGFEGIGPYLLRVGKVTTTQDIPFVQMSRMFDELEAAEKTGGLKELLAK